MKNAALLSGWAVALILGGLLYTQTMQSRALTDELDAAKEEAAVARMAAERLANLEKQNGTPMTSSEAMKAREATKVAAIPTAEEAEPEPDGFAATDLVADILKNKKKDKKTKANPMSAMATMLEGERGEKLMKASVAPMITAQYQELFDALHLPEEQANALRAVLTDHMEANAMAGLDMMREGKVDGAAHTRSDSDLHAAVAEILDPNELATFEQYQSELPARMIRQQYEMQLGMLAPGLSDETRQYTLDVMVDTMLAGQEEVGVEGGDVMGNLDRTRSRLEAMATQLEAELGPEEGAQIRAFVDQQLAGLDMAAAMFGQTDEVEKPE